MNTYGVREEVGQGEVAEPYVVHRVDLPVAAEGEVGADPVQGARCMHGR